MDSYSAAVSMSAFEGPSFWQTWKSAKFERSTKNSSTTKISRSKTRTTEDFLRLFRQRFSRRKTFGKQENISKLLSLWLLLLLLLLIKGEAVLSGRSRQRNSLRLKLQTRTSVENRSGEFCRNWKPAKAHNLVRKRERERERERKRDGERERGWEVIKKLDIYWKASADKILFRLQQLRVVRINVLIQWIINPLRFFLWVHEQQVGDNWSKIQKIRRIF